MNEIALPGRAERDEDAWIASLREAPSEQIEDALRAAMRARRPQLAARLVGLLDEAPDDPEIQRAARAAELLCLGPDHQAAAELDLILMRLIERRRRRFMQRSRKPRNDKRRPNPRSRYRR